MASPNPYPFSGIVYDINGTTPLNGVTVRARNETNNEIISAPTNSEGQYVMDATNFASGYLDTDKITVYVIYTNLEASATLDISDNDNSANLTLTTISDSSLINYCTIQDVYDELDITEDDLTAQKIIKVIQRAEARIDETTQTKFVATTVTDEYYDFHQFNSVKSPEQLMFIGYTGRRDYMNFTANNKFRLNKYPIISISALAKNSASAASADSWTTLTEQEGSGGDFEVELSSGWVTFVNNYPRYGKRVIRMTYVYGHSTVPKQVERLTVLLAVMDIVRTSASNAQYYDASDISIAELSINNRAGAVSAYLNNLKQEINEAWKEVGAFNADLT